LAEEGGRAIVQAMADNTTLTELGLEGNFLGEEGGQAIVQALV
jgi:hypothetical protein